MSHIQLRSQASAYHTYAASPPPPPSPHPPSHTHTHALRSVQNLFRWANSARFGWFHLHLLRSPDRSTTHSGTNKKNHLPGIHLNTQSGVYLLENVVCSLLSRYFHVSSVGKLYTGVVNSCGRLLYFLFLLLWHVLLQTLCFCSFSTSCDYMNAFLCLPSGFQLLLPAGLCVCCWCPLGFECLCGPFPGSYPRLPPHAAKLCVWPKLLCVVWLHLDILTAVNNITSVKCLVPHFSIINSLIGRRLYFPVIKLSLELCKASWTFTTPA